MQAFEALVSFLFFVFLSSFLLNLAGEQRYVDDSLYRVQLAEDAWRVLYLRGDFEDFGPNKRSQLEDELETIEDETGLCVFIDGVFITSCRGGSREHQLTASLRKTVIYTGALKNVTFSIGR